MNPPANWALELKYLGPAYLDSVILNANLKKQTIEVYTGACPRCLETRMFVGYDLGRPTSTMCFYCEVTAELYATRSPHPDMPAARRHQRQAAAGQCAPPIAREKPKPNVAESASVKQAVLEALRMLATAWPGGEVPSSRLWATVVDRGAVAVVRPGLAADGEAHRYYKAKESLIRQGLIREARGFVCLAAPAKAMDSEPTFAD